MPHTRPGAFALRAAALALSCAAVSISPAFAADAPATGAGANSAASERGFTPDDLFKLSGVTDPQISPDGSRIAYVRSAADVMTDKVVPSIWLVDAASGAQRPLVTGAGAHFSPRWSPDGKRLAYVSSDGNGAPQLYVMWLDGSAKVKVTGLPDSPGSLAWSPDGRQIAYTMRVPGEGLKMGSQPSGRPEGAQWAEPLQVIDRVSYRADGGGYARPGYDHIFVVSADGGAPRQLPRGRGRLCKAGLRSHLRRFRRRGRAAPAHLRRFRRRRSVVLDAGRPPYRFQRQPPRELAA